MTTKWSLRQFANALITGMAGDSVDSLGRTMLAIIGCLARVASNIRCGMPANVSRQLLDESTGIDRAG
jgi:hypothetical protein